MAGPKNIAVQIRELLNCGVAPTDIKKQFGCTLSTVNYHKRRLGKEIKPLPHYDWAAINEYHNQGHSVSECVEIFGFAKGSWHKAKVRGDVTPRERLVTSLDVMLTPGRVNTTRKEVKKLLLKRGILEKKCALCGITEWRGKPLSFTLDHIDGEKLNWALHNLRIVCPNCDSQQDTFAGRNVKRLRLQAESKSIPKSDNR
jgi:5-methylcytosine-specific restriction endonuclease McrA